jgi:hypothetical protein
MLRAEYIKSLPRHFSGTILTVTLALAPDSAVENLLLAQQRKMARSTGGDSVIQLDTVRHLPVILYSTSFIFL